MAENMNTNNTENTTEVKKEKFTWSGLRKKAWNAVKVHAIPCATTVVLTLGGVLLCGMISEKSAVKEVPKPVTFDVGNGVEVTQF